MKTHTDPIVSENKVNELAELLWSQAGKPAGGAGAYHEEAKRRLKDASRKANDDITDRDRSMGESDTVDERMPNITPHKQPIRPS